MPFDCHVGTTDGPFDRSYATGTAPALVTGEKCCGTAHRNPTTAAVRDEHLRRKAGHARTH